MAEAANTPTFQVKNTIFTLILLIFPVVSWKETLVSALCLIIAFYIFFYFLDVIMIIIIICIITSLFPLCEPATILILQNKCRSYPFGVSKERSFNTLMSGFPVGFGL